MMWQQVPPGSGHWVKKGSSEPPKPLGQLPNKVQQLIAKYNKRNDDIAAENARTKKQMDKLH